MATSDVQLLGSWASPFSIRVQMVFNLKSVECEFIEEKFYGKKGERLLRANPVHQKIPVLIHDKKPVCESLVIIQYIDDVWSCNGPLILPSDPYDSAIARFWAAYIDEKWFPLLKELRSTTEDEEKAAIVGKIFEGLMMLEDAFVKCSKGKEFFSGDNAGYIDIVLGSYLGWIGVIESLAGLNLLDVSKTPSLVGWAERFRSHTAAKDVIPEPQKLIEFFMMVQAARASSG